LPACSKSDCSGDRLHFFAEATGQVSRTKIPERGIPGGAFSGGFVRAGSDIPAFHDRPEESVSDQAFPVGARDIAGGDRDDPPVLEIFQNPHGFGQLV